MLVARFLFCFFFNDTATTEIYTLSLHDALPISSRPSAPRSFLTGWLAGSVFFRSEEHTSELQSRGLISYAVFCLKKNKESVRATGLHARAAAPSVRRRGRQA